MLHKKFKTEVIYVIIDKINMEKVREGLPDMIQEYIQKK